MFKPLKNVVAEAEEPGIELFGNKRMIVLDCKCVVDYSEDCIVLCLGKMNAKIRGDNLVISSFAYGQTDVSGKIISLEFEEV